MRTNNKAVNVARVRERLAALHGSQFVAEIYNSLLKEFDEAPVLAGFENTVLQKAGNRGLNMQAALLYQGVWLIDHVRLRHCRQGRDVTTASMWAFRPPA